MAPCLPRLSRAFTGAGWLLSTQVPVVALATGDEASSGSFQPQLPEPVLPSPLWVTTSVCRRPLVSVETSLLLPWEPLKPQSSTFLKLGESHPQVSSPSPWASLWISG